MGHSQSTQRAQEGLPEEAGSGAAQRESSSVLHVEADGASRRFDDRAQAASPGDAGRAAPAEEASQEGVVHVLATDLPRIGAAGMIVLTMLFVTLLCGLFLLGYLPYRQSQAELQAEAANGKDERPLVNVAVPVRQNQATNLVLPADVRAFQETLIYPRTNGYLKRQLVDIGDRVQAGQLLAEIDTPEVDAQLNQAKASVEQAKANAARARMAFALAETTLRRYQDAVKSGGVAQQDFDEKRSQFDQAKAGLELAQAAVVSSQAEVQRFEALQSFEKVTAPFGGVITTRNYDIGALLSSTAAGSGKELFQIDQTDTLRVFVKVPQAYATEVRPGQKAQLMVRNYPGRSFGGTVTRSSGSIDPTTRTLRVEIDVENRENLLFAGMYGQVRLDIMHNQPPLLVPTNALIYNAEGLSLAVVKGEKVCLQKVSTGRDLGMQIEIVDGLAGTELVITNPGEHIREGSEVRVASRPRAVTSTSRPATTMGTAR